MGEKRIAVVVHDDPLGRHVLVDLPLTTLPPIGPEPSLIGRDRQRRPQFQHAVLAFGAIRVSELKSQHIEAVPDAG